MKQLFTELHPKHIIDYGCTRCQKHHDTEDPLYSEHLIFQSKHGIRRWVDVTRWEPEPEGEKEQK